MVAQMCGVKKCWRRYDSPFWRDSGCEIGWAQSWCLLEGGWQILKTSQDSALTEKEDIGVILQVG